MKKNLLTLLIIFLSVLCGSSKLSAQSSGGTWGGIDWTLTDDGTLTIKPTAGEPVGTGYKNQPFTKGQWREAVVYNSSGGASAIGGYPYDVNKVKKLIIEEGVTSIGSFTAKFPNLTGEVVIPKTVTYFGQEAFQNVPITKLTFAPGGTEKLCIGPGAFKKLKITELILPGDRPEIHIHCWAFNDCTSLEHVVIPANVTDFSRWTHVEYCGMDFVNGYDSQIFARCTNLETIVFGSDEVKTKFLNAAGNQSNINTIGATTAYQGLLSIKTIEVGVNHVSASWDAVDGAMGYNVYKGNEIISESQTGTTFTANNLTSNTSYEFAIKAVLEDGESEPSKIYAKTKKQLFLLLKQHKLV